MAYSMVQSDIEPMRNVIYLLIAELSKQKDGRSYSKTEPPSCLPKVLKSLQIEDS